MLTKKILVTGKVQGVFFRQSTMLKAEALSLGGTVENLPDGNTVGIIATGSEAALAELISWCQQGPPGAEVKKVEISDQPLQEFKSISIL